MIEKLQFMTLMFINDLKAPRRRDEKGATAVEYGLMVSLIAGVIIVAVTLIGTNLNVVFNKVAGQLH